MSLSPGTERAVRCRYRQADHNPCPNPAMDQTPDAFIHLCLAHTKKTLDMWHEALSSAVQAAGQ
ncbi:hypothetical protein [Streptosporangium sp. KLBMP 9127]|nr:hypothetical protein [Streptosporangium sp. KLBMP 9127]